MDQKFWDKIDSFGQNGEYDKIVREIKKLPADKMDMELINVLGRAYMYLGDLGNALDTYLSFIGKAEEDTLNADIWLYSEAGWTCNEFEDFEQGLKYLLEAEKLGRDDDWIYLHLYHNLKTTKGAEEALKYFEEQAKIEDKNPVLLEALGNIYMLEAANYEKAEKTFQKAFALSGDGQQLFNRGRALAALKRYEEAIEVLLQSRRISEQEGDVTDGEDMELVRCYIGLKDKKNAEKYLELAREGADNVADEFIDEYEEELDQLEDMIDEL